MDYTESMVKRAMYCSLSLVCVVLLGCVDYDSQDPVVERGGDGLLGLVNLTDNAVTARISGESRIETNETVLAASAVTNETSGSVTNFLVMEIPGESVSQEAPADAQTDVSLAAGFYTVEVTGSGRQGSLGVSVGENQLTRLRISNNFNDPTAFLLRL